MAVTREEGGWGIGKMGEGGQKVQTSGYKYALGIYYVSW